MPSGDSAAGMAEVGGLGIGLCAQDTFFCAAALARGVGRSGIASCRLEGQV